MVTIFEVHYIEKLFEMRGLLYRVSLARTIGRTARVSGLISFRSQSHFCTRIVNTFTTTTIPPKKNETFGKNTILIFLHFFVKKWFLLRQIILSLTVAMALAMPRPDTPYGGNPFFSVKISQAGVGYGATISKQKVNLIKKTADGELVEEEPFIDHQPPFLALPPVKPYEPLPLPSGPKYSN